MQAFSNEGIKDNLCGGCDCKGFVPGVNFNYNAGAKTLTITDVTVYGAGDSRKILHVTIYDGKGVRVVDNIPGNDVDDQKVISTATLDPSEGLTINATVVSANGCLSDGHAKLVGVAVTQGALGSWDKDYDGIIIGSGASSQS